MSGYTVRITTPLGSLMLDEETTSPDMKPATLILADGKEWNRANVSELNLELLIAPEREEYLIDKILSAESAIITISGSDTGWGGIIEMDSLSYDSATGILTLTALDRLTKFAATKEHQFAVGKSEVGELDLDGEKVKYALVDPARVLSDVWRDYMRFDSYTESKLEIPPLYSVPFKAAVWYDETFTDDAYNYIWYGTKQAPSSSTYSTAIPYLFLLRVRRVVDSAQNRSWLVHIHSRNLRPVHHAAAAPALMWWNLEIYKKVLGYVGILSVPDQGGEGEDPLFGRSYLYEAISNFITLQRGTVPECSCWSNCPARAGSSTCENSHKTACLDYWRYATNITLSNSTNKAINYGKKIVVNGYDLPAWRVRVEPVKDNSGNETGTYLLPKFDRLLELLYYWCDVTIRTTPWNANNYYDAFVFRKYRKGGFYRVQSCSLYKTPTCPVFRSLPGIGNVSCLTGGAVGCLAADPFGVLVIEADDHEALLYTHSSPARLKENPFEILALSKAETAAIKQAVEGYYNGLWLKAKLYVETVITTPHRLDFYDGFHTVRLKGRTVKLTEIQKDGENLYKIKGVVI